jgi:dienelactone hydrolase
MSMEVVVFHSALGLRLAIQDFADRLSKAGHVVHTPDLFDGEVFDDLEDGMRKRDAIGVPALMARAQAAVAELPSRLVFIGFSMGTGAAEFLAATRPGSQGAILMHGALAPTQIGVDRWPVPVQMHYAHNDPLVDVEQIQALEASARLAGVPAEVYTYDNVGHLFEDPALAGHDPSAAEVMFDRVLAFLARIDGTRA